MAPASFPGPYTRLPCDGSGPDTKAAAHLPASAAPAQQQVATGADSADRFGEGGGASFGRGDLTHPHFQLSSRI